MSKHVAIGTDGNRPVVWGMGDTAEEAMADAASELREQCEVASDFELRCVEVSDDRAAIVTAGDVDASDL